jgi:hypothetical protein
MTLKEHVRSGARISCMLSLTRLVCPQADGGGNGKAASASGQVLAVWAERTARVLEHATVGPLLCRRRERVVPNERFRAVLRTDSVVRVKVRGDVPTARVLVQGLDGTCQSGRNACKSEESDGRERLHDEEWTKRRGVWVWERYARLEGNGDEPRLLNISSADVGLGAHIRT